MEDKNTTVPSNPATTGTPATSPSRKPGLSKRTLALMGVAGAATVGVGIAGTGTLASSEELASPPDLQIVIPADVNFSLRDFVVEYFPGLDALLGAPNNNDWDGCPACGMG